MKAYLEDFNKDEDFRVIERDFVTLRNPRRDVLDDRRAREGGVIPHAKLNLVLFPESIGATQDESKGNSQ